MNNNLPRNSAFTLVELLISMIIIMVILGLSAAGYNGLRTTQMLKQSAESIKSDIMYAKRSAMLIKRDEGENWINGIGVDLASLSMEDGGYRLFKFCDDERTYVNFANQSISSVVSTLSIPEEGEGSYIPLSPADYYGDCKTIGTSEFTSIAGYVDVALASESVQFSVSKDADPLLNSLRFLFFESPSGKMHLYDCIGNEILLTDDHGPVWLVFNLGSRSYQLRIDPNGDIVSGIYDGDETVELVNVCENNINLFE